MQLSSIQSYKYKKTALCNVLPLTHSMVHASLNPSTVVQTGSVQQHIASRVSKGEVAVLQCGAGLVESTLGSTCTDTKMMKESNTGNTDGQGTK